MNKIPSVQWCGGLRMLLVIIGMATSLTAQDQWPAAITPHRHEDTLFAATPTKFIRGWNFGLPVRHTSNAMQTNMKHFSFTDMLITGDSTALTTQGHDLLNESPDSASTAGFTMYLVPSFRFRYIMPIPNIDPIDPDTNFHLSSDSYNAADVAIGFRYEPEMDAHDTTDVFTPDAAASPGAAFGFRTRFSADTTVGHRRLIRAASHTGAENVLSNVWPQDQLHGRFLGDPTTATNDVENTKQMMIVVNLRRGDGAPDDNTGNQNETVLTIRLPYKLGNNGTTANNIRFTRVPDGTATPVQLNSVDASYGLTLDRVAPTGNDREFRITRRMIPSATAGTRDINLVATFDCDNGGSHNPFFKTGLGSHVDGPDSNRITSTDIEVEYNPTIDVAVDFIGVRTTQAHRWLCGWYQEAIRVAHDTALYNLRKFDSLTGRHYKIHRIYGRNEASPQFWEGLRHYSLSENHNVISEVAIEWPKRFKHHTEIDRLWQGNTAKFGASTYSPAIWQGNTNGRHDSVAYPWHGYACGYDRQINGSGLAWDKDPFVVGWFRADYDVYSADRIISGTPSKFNCDLPLPSTVIDGLVGKLDGLSPNGNNSPLAALETTLTHQKFHGGFLFDSTMWYANIWTDVKVKKIAATSRFMWGGDARPKTAEEIRMQMWNQVVLGTKGLVVYYGPSELRRRVLQTYTENRDFQLGLTYSMEANQFDTAGAMATLQSTYTNASNELGYDFIPTTTAPDSLGLSNLLLNATLAHDPAFFADSQRVATNRLYLGLRSTRMEAARIMTQIQTVEDSLIHLHMLAWKAVGFRSWVAGDSTLMAGYMSLDTAHQFVRPVNRMNAQGYPAKEDNDSMFYDITLHSKDGLDADSIFYVGALNRRTNPRVRSVYPVTTSDPRDSILFFTGEEWRDSVRTGNWHRMSQLGSRLIRIPFNYTRKTDAAYNLRIKEVSWDTSVYSGPKIDTTVGGDVALEIAFQPGEGKFFRVEAVRASGSTEARGFLDHSNQRKMVAYPKAVRIDTITDPNSTRKYLRTIVGDTVRYHMVYHRRPTPTTTNDSGPVSVYYRRSEPVHMAKDTITGSQSAFDASLLHWESEILLSDALRDLITTESPVDRGQLSCAYPALVVRTDSVAGSPNTMQSRVYVVYGCEYRESETAPWQVFISEAVLPADSSHSVQGSYHTTFPPNVIARTYPPATGATRLEDWGTPMINASATGNFYCWPNINSGIDFGFKLPDQVNFVATQTASVRGRMGTAATHPSLNTYSRLYLGEEDAALVWQEGDSASPSIGKCIFYTRLFHATTYPHAPRFDLNAGGAANRQLITTIPLVDGAGDPNNRIALLTDENVVMDDANVRANHAYPVVYRHLSDWEAVSTDSLYTLRPVNNKADRIYWQTQKYYPAVGKWRITRRPVDVHEWFVMNGTADKIWTMAPHYIFDQSNHLMGPDVAQGTQWGDPSSNPANPAPWYADSTVVLNFWSDTSTSSSTPRLWHMQYGWNYYGQNVDHDRADLVTAGWMKNLMENGRYPHLAARHSYMQGKEWMRNRRIFEATGATRTNFNMSPNIMQSSQYFYKEATNASQPMAIRYGGFRGGNNAALLGPIIRHETSEMIPMTGEDRGPNDQRDQADQHKLVSSWMEVPAVSDVSLLSMSEGTDRTANLYVERESTGELLEVEPSQTTQVGVVVPNAQNGASEILNVSQYTMLGSENERYRFVLLAERGDVYQVEDIQLVQPDEAEAFSKTLPTKSQILDLRSMKKNSNVAVNDIVVSPSPARDQVRIVVNMRAGVDTRNTPVETSCIITDERGAQMHRVKCNSVDALTVQVSTWPTGVYNVRVMSELPNGSQAVTAKSFMVLR